MKNRGALYVGLLLIVLGGFFFLAQTTGRLPFGIHLGWRLWPLLVVIVGFAFWLPLAIWWDKRREIAGLVVPGTIVAFNGLLLLYQSLSGNWASWSYAWALEPVSVALGLLFLYYLTNRDPGLLVAAAIVGGVGLVFFVIFASAFGGAIRFLGPLALIAVGLLVLLGALKGHRPFPNE
jgi:hypothetical protein